MTSSEKKYFKDGISAELFMIVELFMKGGLLIKGGYFPGDTVLGETVFFKARADDTKYSTVEAAHKLFVLNLDSTKMPTLELQKATVWSLEALGRDIDDEGKSYDCLHVVTSSITAAWASFSEESKKDTCESTNNNTKSKIKEDKDRLPKDWA